MRILAFSDWRIQLIEPLYEIVSNIEPSLDLILYGGDDVRRFVSPSCNHFHGLAQAADADLGFVLGNDDHPNGLSNLQIETSRVTDLHRNPLTMDEHTVIGQSGAVGESAMGPIQYTEDQAATHLNQQYADVDCEDYILVSHTPPYGALDYGQRFEGGRIGSHVVKEFATRTSPLFVLCGHVHQFGGQTANKDYSPVINVASHDSTGAAGRIALIDIDDKDNSSGIEITHTTLEQLLRYTSGVDETLSTSSSLQKLTQIGSSRAEDLQEAGITSISDIATLEKEELFSQTRLPQYCLERVYPHARAFHDNETKIQDADKYERLREDGTVFVDIETDLEQSQVWCIGLYSCADDEFTQLVSLDDEQALFEDFREYLDEHGSPRLVYYAGNRFDEKYLSEGAERTNVQLSDVVAEWIDACLISRKSIFHPTEGHELDTIASGLGFVFAHPEVGGLEIGSAYSVYRSEGESPEDGWKQYLEYNLDDVLAIKYIIEKVGELAGPDGQFEGVIEDKYTPDNRSQYEICTDPLQTDPALTTGEEQSAESTEKTTDTDFQPDTGPDPYDILDASGSVVKHWTEENPVSGEPVSAPSCLSCGKVLVEKGDRMELTTDERTRFVCEDGCKIGGLQRTIATAETHVASSPDSAGNSSGSSSLPTSTSELVSCHECGEVVKKRVATGKLRVNDEQTLWYCSSCQ